MPSAHAHLHDDGDDAGGDSPLWDRPILLADIDRILEDSAGVEHARGATPIRAWRDELTLALGSLDYARSVLASDVGILRHCLGTEGCDGQTVVDELPNMLASRPGDDGESAPCDPEDPSWLDSEVFVRCDQLMPAHLEMARTDLSSSEDMTRQLEKLEEQLAVLSERHDAVRVRLTQIRAAIVRQYHEGAVPTRNWPG